ncbi:MAG: VCBS repeat-containing protein [Deltaproteobacteria bacterium]|nr:VCBS repeat-containing protein [Deltaproteobacteria bacterium]
MKAYIRAAVLAMAVVFAAASTAEAAKTFTVAPFVVNGSAAYKYLETSIPDMFASRLFWQGHFEPAKKTGTTRAIAPTDEAAAKSALAAAGADYVVWGSVTVVGENCSIDARVLDTAGQSWPISRESTVKRLIQDLRQVSDSISAQVFQKPQTQAQARQPQPVERINQMNPDLVRNQTTPAEVYINPQFRYSGGSGDDSRLRSQTLGFASLGMEICDATGDGQLEVFLLEEKRLHAFRFEADNKLKPLGTLELSAMQYGLSIRSMDLDGSGRSSLIVNLKDEDEDFLARIFTFDGKEFKETARSAGTYLNVVNMAPTYRPMLLGQRSNKPQLFRQGIHEAFVRNGKIVLGGTITMPKDFNVFNFACVPPGTDPNDTAKLVMLEESERIRLYSEKGGRLSSTEERYSGASQGIEVNQAMPGMGRDTVIQDALYYIPMRFLVTDLDDDGNYEIIVNKPISTAAAFFGRYRSFPQSEIQSLQWDGIGLALVWKTRRIKGSVVDYTIADPNGDGIPDLVVCVNTHPGPLGTSARKTIVVLYPLDLSKADPETTPHFSE